MHIVILLVKLRNAEQTSRILNVYGETPDLDFIVTRGDKGL